MHKKLIDLEIIARPLGQSDYLLTELALFYEPGEIRKTTMQTGFKKRYNRFNGSPDQWFISYINWINAGYYPLDIFPYPNSLK